MIGAVPPDYSATFFGVIDEDAALAAADAERVAERAEFEPRFHVSSSVRLKRICTSENIWLLLDCAHDHLPDLVRARRAAEVEPRFVDQSSEIGQVVGQVVVPWNMRAIEKESAFFTGADAPQPIELERCLYLADAATCRARMFCLILAKRATSDGGMDGSLPAELWLHCAVMCPVTTVQKWVRCRFAEWVVASDENWHSGYDGLLNEYQLALRNHRNGATDLKRQARKPRQPITANARLMELESVLSHDEWEPVEDRDWLWADLAELLASHPHLRTILNVPEEVMAEAWALYPALYRVQSSVERPRLCHVRAPAKLSNVIDKWEYAERIVTRRSFGHIAHWDAHCDVPIAHLLTQRPVARPLFYGQSDGSDGIKQLGCMQDGYPANINAASSEQWTIEYFDQYEYNMESKVHCSLADLFTVDWDVSCASAEHSGGEELQSTDSVVGTHQTRRQLVGDDFCVGLAALERQIVGAGLSSADFRLLFCI